VIAYPLVFLGNILVAMRGLLPGPVTMILGHTLLKSRGVATLAGILDFKGSRLPKRLAIGILSVYIFPLMFSPLLAQDQAARSFFALSQSLVLYFITAIILLRPKGKRLGMMELFSAFFLFSMVFLNAVRLVFILRLGYAVESGGGPSWDALITILDSVAFMGLVDGLLGMVPNFSTRAESAVEWLGGIRNRIACIAEAHGLLVVSDDGIGTSWPPEREGFGSVIIGALVAQIKGELEYRNEAGSTWRISFPLSPGVALGSRKV
jgi:hypothetical protein